jgi:hypothetical protein
MPNLENIVVNIGFSQFFQLFVGMGVLIDERVAFIIKSFQGCFELVLIIPEPFHRKRISREIEREREKERKRERGD